MDKENQFRNNVYYIKKWYKENKNGLLITNRRIGKTQALIEILYAENWVYNKDIYLVVSKNSSKKHCQERLLKYFLLNNEQEFKTKKDFDGKIISLFNYIITPKEIKSWMGADDLIIDEYFWIERWIPKFRFAISSPIFPIQVTKFDNDVNDEKLKKEVPDQQYKLEHSLNFKVYNDDK